MARHDPFGIDAHKIHLHPRWVARWLEGRNDWRLARDIPPLYGELSPVGFCNHGCTFCGVDFMLARPEKPSLTLEVMDRMLHDMGRFEVRSLMFAGAGEPLLWKPGLAKAIQIADKAGIDTSLTTNAVLMDEHFVREALPVGRFRWVKVSLNGGDAETYARIHRAKPGDFEKVLKNLERAVQMRPLLASQTTIGVQLVALPEVEGLPSPKAKRLSVLQGAVPPPTEGAPSNMHTIVPLVHRLREIGVNYLVIKPYSQHLMSTGTRAYEAVARYAEAWTELEQLADELSDEHFQLVVRSETMHTWDTRAEGRGYETCSATPFSWFYVEADGEVWGCSAYLGRDEGDTHFGDDRFRYGNVNEAAFSEIWRGERRKANWEYVRNGLDISECRVNCRMDAVNRYLNRLVHPQSHDTFI